MKLNSLTAQLSAHLLISKCLQELQDAMKQDLMGQIAANKSLISTMKLQREVTNTMEKIMKVKVTKKDVNVD